MLFFLGLGLLVTKKWQVNPAEKLFYTFFVGWAGLIVVLQIWNLFLPVNAIAFWLLLALSILGLVIGIRTINGEQKEPISKIVFFAVIGAVVIALLANQSLYATVSYDHGLYHRPMVNWLESFPLVKGLGNLHHRFAFNNSSFLNAALLDSSPAKGLIYYSFLPTLFAMLLMRMLLAGYRVFSGGWQVKEVFYALMLPVYFWQVSRMDSASIGFATDPVIYVLQVVAIAEFLGIFIREQLDTFNRQRAVFLALLLSVGVTVKLSFAVFAGLFFVIILWSIWKALEATKSDRIRMTRDMAVVGLAAIIPWMLRGVILSGFPLFPSKVLSIHVKWRMPFSYVDPVPQVIRNWAQHGGDLPASSPLSVWFPYWTQHQLFETWIVLILFAVFMAVYLAGIRYFGKAKQQREVMLALGVVLISLAIWFIQAPSERFAAGLIWMLPIFPMVLLMNKIKSMDWLENKAFVVLLGFALLTFWFKPQFKNYVSLSENLLVPVSEHQVNANQMAFDVNRSDTTRSGLIVYIASDQNEERCYDQPLPCTRKNDFDERLSLIKPGVLASGFWIDNQNSTP